MKAEILLSKSTVRPATCGCEAKRSLHRWSLISATDGPFAWPSNVAIFRQTSGSTPKAARKPEGNRMAARCSAPPEAAKSKL